MQISAILRDMLDWLSNHLLVQLVVLVLSVSSFILVLDSVGFLPDAVSRWFNRKRLLFSVELLREMGVKMPHTAEIVYSVVNYKEAARQVVLQSAVNKPVTVGRVDGAAFPEFVDVMGACTDAVTAMRIARILSTHGRRNTQLFKRDGQALFDIVACPKTGSPILAYEFARIVNKPLVLYPESPKFEDATADPHGRFDFKAIDLDDRSLRALLVDDSTTGGRQMLALASDLRKSGCQVHHCLVLFEPIGKGARERLKENRITLHAVVEGPKASG